MLISNNTQIAKSQWFRSLWNSIFHFLNYDKYKSNRQWISVENKWRVYVIIWLEQQVWFNLSISANLAYNNITYRMTTVVVSLMMAFSSFFKQNSLRSASYFWLSPFFFNNSYCFCFTHFNFPVSDYQQPVYVSFIYHRDEFLQSKLLLLLANYFLLLYNREFYD